MGEWLIRNFAVVRVLTWVGIITAAVVVGWCL